MTPKFVSLVLLAALALMAAPSAEAETAAVGAGPGRLLFASTRTADGNSEIYSADIAGEQATNLTADPAPDIAPAWSPDGRQIAFASRRDQNWDLYLMQSDGTGLRRLTDSQAYDSDPAWSPDGEQIAFSSTRSGNLDIYLMAPHGRPMGARSLLPAGATASRRSTRSISLGLVVGRGIHPPAT
jgi:Tol biopolymer transport system component